MTQLDIFTRYPRSAGYKSPGTSKQAARAITKSGRASTLREQVLEVLRDRALTADEVAQELQESVLSIRPRLTELAKLNQIADAGSRRKNESGKLATVWRVK